MALTLAEVLELEPLRRAGARIVAGSEHAERSVRWVHSAEVLDIAQFLAGGELLLTTGIELTKGREVRRRFVADLAQAHAAGLALELHRAFPEVPQDLVEACSAEALPLVELSGPLRHVEITQFVHAAIVNHQLGLITSAEAMGRSLTELVLAGAELPDLARELAKTAGTLAVVEDAAHQVLAFGGDDPWRILLPTNWQRHSRRGHEPPTSTGVVVDEGSEHRCAWLNLWLPDGLWGRVHLVETGRPLDELSCLFLDRAGAAIQIALRDRRQRLAEREAGRARLLEGLLTGVRTPETALVDAARALGADFDGRRLVAMVLAPLVDQHRSRQQASEAVGADELRHILTEARVVARQEHLPELSTLHAGTVALLVGLADEGPRTNAAEASAAIVRSLERRVNLPIAAGVAEPGAGPGRLQRAFAEAGRALVFARASRRTTPVDAADLGLEHLLETIADGPELARFVEHELAPLLDHDATTSTPLLPTLQAVLDHPGNRSRAADALSIDRRTLYHRLCAIEGLLGRRLADPATRRALEVALVALDVLGERSARGATPGA